MQLLFMQYDNFCKFDLNSLEFEERFALVFHEEIKLRLKVLNLKLCLQISAVFFIGLESVSFCLSVLAHHDDGGLHCSETRKNQIQEDKGIRVKSFISNKEGIENHPY